MITDSINLVGPPAEEEPIRLELAVQEDGTPPTNTAWMSALAGTGLSVLFHCWLTFTLAGIIIDNSGTLEQEPLDTHFVNPAPPELTAEAPEFDLANPDDREMEVRKAINAASIGLEIAEKPKLEAAPVMIDFDVDPTLKSLPLYDIPQGQMLSKSVVVAGTTGEAMIQLDAALDRVTHEIANNLKESKVLVVWLIDASGSLVPQRAALNRRLQRIYGELDALNTTDQLPKVERPILSGVVTFGAKTTFVTKEPTEKFEEVQAAIKNAPTDDSGIENVFTAVNQVIEAWSHKYRGEGGRRTLLLTVTDEAGDDHGLPLETAIAKCERYGVRSYVIGPAAPFGRRKGYVPYVAKEDGKTYQIPVDLGPENVVVDNIDLPFWYEGPQYTYLSSGFGPYALSRLVSETGGVYFMTNMTTTSGLATYGEWDPGIMKGMAPDYRFSSPDQFMKDLSKHPLRMAVVAAAEYSQQTNLRAQGTPDMEFKVQPNNFRQTFTEAQKSAAISSLAIDNIFARMPPNPEKSYAAEPSPRWRVSFDLLYGRILAQKIRSFEYNMCLAQMKTTYAESDIANKVNRFILRPSKDLNYAPSLKKQARMAEECLQRVLEEAPGTPWALLAQRELRDGMGIRVIEKFDPPPPPQPKADPKTKLAPKFIPDAKKTQPKTPAPKPIVPTLPKL